MKLSIKPRRYLPCSLEVFRINGKRADESDFGHTEDIDKESAEPYACGNNIFLPDEEINKEALEKYGISENEYREIQDSLEEALRVGKCGWCI